MFPSCIHLYSLAPPKISIFSIIPVFRATLNCGSCSARQLIHLALSPRVLQWMHAPCEERRVSQGALNQFAWRHQIRSALSSHTWGGRWSGGAAAAVGARRGQWMDEWVAMRPRLCNISFDSSARERVRVGLLHLRERWRAHSPKRNNGVRRVQKSMARCTTKDNARAPSLSSGCTLNGPISSCVAANSGWWDLFSAPRHFSVTCGGEMEKLNNWTKTAWPLSRRPGHTKDKVILISIVYSKIYRALSLF
jgi:hypothetical protein